MRITPKILKAEAARFTQYQIASGSTWIYVAGARDGYQTVDLYRVDADGRLVCASFLEGGTSRECVHAIYGHHKGNYGYIWPQKPGEITRVQALRVLELYGLDFKYLDDYSQCGLTNLDVLNLWAKLTKYRKPKNANGSTGRYFFNHLVHLKRRIEK